MPCVMPECRASIPSKVKQQINCGRILWRTIYRNSTRCAGRLHTYPSKQRSNTNKLDEPFQPVAPRGWNEELTEFKPSESLESESESSDPEDHRHRSPIITGTIDRYLPPAWQLCKNDRHCIAPKVMPNCFMCVDTHLVLHTDHRTRQPTRLSNLHQYCISKSSDHSSAPREFIVLFEGFRGAKNHFERVGGSFPLKNPQTR